MFILVRKNELEEKAFFKRSLLAINIRSQKLEVPAHQTEKNNPVGV